MYYTHMGVSPTIDVMVYTHVLVSPKNRFKACTSVASWIFKYLKNIDDKCGSFLKNIYKKINGQNTL